MSPILRAAVYHEGACRLEAVVDDGAGWRRRIDVSWFAREASPLPPADWFQMVEGEVRYQLGGGDRNPFARMMAGGPGR